MTIAELQKQKRWVLWKLEAVNGKQTKVPYQPNGRKAMANNPATWQTYAACAAVVSHFSGVGVTLGDGIFGVDIDKCCDAVTGKFTAESREIVIGLDSYSEYSPSGTGCHVFCVGEMPEKYRGFNTGKKGDSIVRAIPGCKQIELKASGFYFTYSAWHLTKTPADLMPRQEQINALCDRVAAITQSKAGANLVVSADSEEKYRKLMAGDLSDFNSDYSRADLALCNFLARKFSNNFFKIDEAWLASPLNREKLERTDYRSATILKAIKGETVFEDSEDELIEDDGVDEYLVESLGAGHEGWFPAGDISLIGGSSGSGKTYWVMTLLEKVRRGGDVWGHKTAARDYRVLMHDRGAKGMRRTLNALGLSADAKERVIRLSRKQQALKPAEVLEACIDRTPGVQAWFIEGLDMWFPDVLKMNVVAPLLDDLQRLATRKNVAVIATVGAPKEKTAAGKDSERYHGRDALFGSAALARKAETVVLISKTDMDDENSPRQYSVLPRNGRAERFWMSYTDGALLLVDRPETKELDRKSGKSDLLKRNVLARYKPGERVVYTPLLGVSRPFYYDWAKLAVADGLIEQREGMYWMPTERATA
ncbi:MAG: AAA family ATPase [Candidatus Sulfotelmatobacter sp.]